jgi:hypothetical protein
MKELVLVLLAADAAARWHVNQRRKGAAQEPYINHLLEVASLVTEATSGADPNVVIAALLHDAIEDQGVTAATIASQFGKLAADIVMEVTDDKALPKAERKRLQVEHAPHKSREAKLIKLRIESERLKLSAPFSRWIAEPCEGAAIPQAHGAGCRLALFGGEMLRQEFYDGFFDVSGGNAGDRSG